jgi:hypothetical protein
VGVFTLGDLYQLLDDVRRRGAIGVAHAQVDDVLATAAGGHLQLGGDVENVGGDDRCAQSGAANLGWPWFLFT